MKNKSADQLVTQLWHHIGSQEWDQAKALLAPEFEAYWPQSNEKFNRDNFIEVNRTYPGAHEIQIMNVWSENDQWDRIDTVMSEVHIKSKTPEGKDVELFAISIFEVEDDGEYLIRSAREYWADTYPVPAWRKRLSTPYDTRKQRDEKLEPADRIVHTILYVSDQKRSRDFYANVLGEMPILDVPGMTEFQLSKNHILGLMPEAGIKRLLGSTLGDFAQGSPKAELYLRVSNPEELFIRALESGAKELSPILRRDWGDRAGYAMDHDCNVLAIATKAGP